MNKTILWARIKDQRLQLVNEPLIASGGVDVLRINFEFCDLWEGCGKTAVFYRDPATVYHVLIDETPGFLPYCIVPPEVLADEGSFYFGVMGAASNVRTTEVVKVQVARGAITTATAVSDPTPNIYEQIMMQYGSFEARFNEVIALHGNSGSLGDHVIEDNYIFLVLSSNGVHCYADISVDNLTLTGYGNHTTDWYRVPLSHAPMRNVTLENGDKDLRVQLIVGEIDYDEAIRLVKVGIGNLNSESASYTTYAQAYYPPVAPALAEVADMRIPLDYTSMFPKAGDYVRSVEQRVADNETNISDLRLIALNTGTSVRDLETTMGELESNFEMAPGSVTVGKNLLNLNAPMPDPNDVYSGGFLRGYLFNDAGEISVNAYACITDYIPVQEGYIMGSSSYGDAGRVGMAFRRVMGYDEDKNLIGLLVSSKRIVTPTELDGVAYVRMQVTTTYADAEGQIEYIEKDNGGYGTEYEPYTETVVWGDVTLKPECLPAEFDELAERVTELETNGGGDTLAIDRARFDDRFNYIAYSSVFYSGCDINSREHFLWAAKQDFTALKGDIEVTADGKLVMCHDEGFTLDDEGKIIKYNSATATPIHDMTEAECLALRHATRGHAICSFEEYIRICKKYGKIPYITIRNHYVDEAVPEMMRVLRKYSMVKRCIVSAFPYFAPLEAVRAADPTIMLAYVLGHNADITIADIDLAISMGNMLISGFQFGSDFYDVDGVAERLAGSLEAIEYAQEKDVRIYNAQLTTMDIADKLMEYGITGAQILFNPTFE